MAFAFGLATGGAWALQVVPDDELGAVQGQIGIALQFDLRVNADEYGQALTSPSEAANPSAFTYCASLTDFSSTGCRLALQFANRNDNGGEWLVGKNFYGRMYFPEIHIGGGRTPAAATIHEDLDRFKDDNGVPLLASPHDIPALFVEFPGGIEMWNVTIGGLSVEYGATGYLNNANVPFAGIKIGNTAPNAPAFIDTQGTVTVFGF
jgi:hypothetical protein